MDDKGNLSKQDLKEAVQRIVLAQGNIFIRDLLKAHGIKVGLNKKDFRSNLDQAIDDDRFTQAMLEDWIGVVEGWGNQHIYVYEPPDLRPAALRPLLEKSEFVALIDRPVSYDFPDELTLSSMIIDAAGLSIVWHRSSTGWARDEAKDRREEIEGDLYEFRAYRQRFDRAVVRFEWRFTDSYCAVMLQLPHEGNIHEVALGRIWDDLIKIGIVAASLPKISLNTAVKRLSRSAKVIVQTSKVMTAGGYVELGSTTPDTGIGSIEAVREVQKGVNDAKFKKADGMFSLEKATHVALSKTIKLQGYGDDSRIRVWVQCKREDIHFLLTYVHDHTKAA